MLNELYNMARIVKQKGILQEATHQDIKEPGSFAGVYVEVNKNKQPCNIEYMAKEELAKTWKHAKGGHNSFPIIRIQKPFLLHDFSEEFDERWKKANSKEQKLKLLDMQKLNTYKYNFESKDILVKKWTIDKLMPICEGVRELKALYDLIDVFPKNSEDQVIFYSRLVSIIKESINSFDSSMLDLIKDILVGSYDRKKKQFYSKTLIVFDVYNTQNYIYKVKDKRLRKVLISELIKKEMTDSCDLNKEICQLTGERRIIEKDKYPNPNLRVVGTTYLYSSNKDILCLKRYGLKGLETFKAGVDIKNDMNDALIFLTHEDRHYKTWVQVPGKTAKEFNLLIAYVEHEPESDDEIAKMLGDSPNYEQDVIKFETLTEKICSSLIKKTEINTNVTINSFVINKVDDGRKQIMFSRVYTSNDIISNTRKWVEAFKNSPKIEFTLKEQSGAKTIKLHCPYPGEIITFARKLWRVEVNGGKKNLIYESATGITLKDVYEVFIPIEYEEISVKNMLAKIIVQSKYLLINIGHHNYRNELLEVSKYLHDACLALSLMSILLYKQGCRKEDFMNSVAFNIGRLMMLSDVLHREYCKNVRRDVPPQLIGNSIMHTAVEFPIRALNLLEERIMIYKAWADTNMETDVKYAKWAINQMGIVTKAISEQEIPNSFNDVERAQVLLGYLAKIDKKEED